MSSLAYQMEGAVSEDGRGESIWYWFCATPGKVRNGESGAVACDFYNRYREDIGLLRDLGVDAFRFSVAVPAGYCPRGRGELNQKGSAFMTGSWTPCSKLGSSPWPSSTTGTFPRYWRTRAVGPSGLRSTCSHGVLRCRRWAPR